MADVVMRDDLGRLRLDPLDRTLVVQDGVVDPSCCCTEAGEWAELLPCCASDRAAYPGGVWMDLSDFPEQRRCADGRPVTLDSTFVFSLSELGGRCAKVKRPVNRATLAEIEASGLAYLLVSVYEHQCGQEECAHAICSPCDNCCGMNNAVPRCPSVGATPIFDACCRCGDEYRVIITGFLRQSLSELEGAIWHQTSPVFPFCPNIPARCFRTTMRGSQAIYERDRQVFLQYRVVCRQLVWEDGRIIDITRTRSAYSPYWRARLANPAGTCDPPPGSEGLEYEGETVDDNSVAVYNPLGGSEWELCGFPPWMLRQLIDVGGDRILGIPPASGVDSRCGIAPRSGFNPGQTFAACGDDQANYVEEEPPQAWNERLVVTTGCGGFGEEYTGQLKKPIGFTPSTWMHATERVAWGVSAIIQPLLPCDDVPPCPPGSAPRGRRGSTGPLGLLELIP